MAVQVTFKDGKNLVVNGTTESTTLLSDTTQNILLKFGKCRYYFKTKIRRA